MKLHYIPFALTLAFFVSCGDSEDSPTEKPKTSTTNSVEDVKGFKPMEILFDDKKFGSQEEKELLLELKICTEDPLLLKTSEMPPCSPENFKFLPLSKDISIKNGFLLLIKAETGGFPLRRLLVFQRERGELVKVNGFVANIIGRNPTASGYDDLLLRFYDKDDGGFKLFYNCLFTWEDGQYQFKEVDVIEGPNWGGKVKKEHKVETSKDIYQRITENKMIF